MSKEQWFRHYERRLNEFEDEVGRPTTPEEDQWCARKADDDLLMEHEYRADQIKVNHKLQAERHSPDHGIIETLYMGDE